MGRDIDILHVRLKKDGSMKRVSPLGPLIRWRKKAERAHPPRKRGSPSPT